MHTLLNQKHSSHVFLVTCDILNSLQQHKSSEVLPCFLLIHPTVNAQSVLPLIPTVTFVPTWPPPPNPDPWQHTHGLCQYVHASHVETAPHANAHTCIHTNTNQYRPATKQWAQILGVLCQMRDRVCVWACVCVFVLKVNGQLSGGQSHCSCITAR